MLSTISSFFNASSQSPMSNYKTADHADAGIFKSIINQPVEAVYDAVGGAKQIITSPGKLFNGVHGDTISAIAGGVKKELSAPVKMAFAVPLGFIRGIYNHATSLMK